MATVEINSCICGHCSTVRASMDGKVCKLEISSSCQAIQRFGEELVEVNPLQEISCRRGIPQTLQMGQKHCFHAACPVPVGTIKAIEVAANLALPKDPAIRISKE